MPSQPDETADMDLAHVIQYAQLASMIVCNARKIVMPDKRRVTLTIQEENELLDYLNGIEERARAASTKFTMVKRFYPLLEQMATDDLPVPNEYIGGSDLPSKLLRYYNCVECSKPHWEDERPIFDEHVGYRACAGGQTGFRFGHRTQLGLVK